MERLRRQIDATSRRNERASNSLGILFGRISTLERLRDAFRMQLESGDDPVARRHLARTMYLLQRSTRWAAQLENECRYLDAAIEHAEEQLHRVEDRVLEGIAMAVTVSDLAYIQGLKRSADQDLPVQQVHAREHTPEQPDHHAEQPDRHAAHDHDATEGGRKRRRH